MCAFEAATQVVSNVPTLVAQAVINEASVLDAPQGPQMIKTGHQCRTDTTGTLLSPSPSTSVSMKPFYPVRDLAGKQTRNNTSLKLNALSHICIHLIDYKMLLLTIYIQYLTSTFRYLFKLCTVVKYASF